MIYRHRNPHSIQTRETLQGRNWGSEPITMGSSDQVTAPHKSDQPYRALEWPAEDTADVPVQRQLHAVYVLTQSYVPSRKNTRIQEPRGRSRNGPHLPPFPMIH